MKKVVTLLAALLLVAVSASAQLSIGGKSESSKRLATLQTEWAWLYQSNGRYFYVSKTTNQFDRWMWLDLGETPRDAARTILSLRDAMDGCKKGDQVEVTSMSEVYMLSYEETLGMRYFWIHARNTRQSYAGMGQMTEGSLKKAYNYLTK